MKIWTSQYLETRLPGEHIKLPAVTFGNWPCRNSTCHVTCVETMSDMHVHVMLGTMSCSVRCTCHARYDVHVMLGTMYMSCSVRCTCHARYDVHVMLGTMYMSCSVRCTCHAQYNVHVIRCACVETCRTWHPLAISAVCTTHVPAHVGTCVCH